MPIRATAAPAAPSAASLRSIRRAATACRPRICSSSTPRQVSLSYAAVHPAANLRRSSPNGSAGASLLGSPDQVRRFVERAMSRLDAPLEPGKSGTVRAHLSALPAAVAERLAARGLEGTVRLAFEEPPPVGRRDGRAQPSAARDACGNALLEGALDPAFEPGAVARPRRRMADSRPSRR